MSKNNKAKLDLLNRLNQELQTVRHESLAASRRGDFRAVGRLTCEAARLNRLILATEDSHVPSLVDLGDRLFTGDSTDPIEPAPTPLDRELAAA